jgi:hypothetical protein
MSLALFLCSISFVALAFAQSSGSRGADASAADNPIGTEERTTGDESPEVAAFRKSVGGSITPVIVELKGEPGVIRKVNLEERGESVSMESVFAYAQELVGRQDAFRGSLAQHGIRAMMRETHVRQIDGSIRHIQYRFTYLLNGFVAYVATDDLEKLRAHPEVAIVSEAESSEFHLDRAIDHSLGTQMSLADRRTAVYGATQEFQPAGSPGHPETPKTTTIDGFEGQNMIVAVIDTGIDWRHPMFGGTGVGLVDATPQPTPRPRVSGQPASPDDNQKVIYYYAMSSPGDITDDFGHGTVVASCVAGYSVDANTPVRNGFGTGRDGTGVGPTLDGKQLFGTAPQARLMAYKVCGPANSCAGDIPLAIEDAASPYTLVGSGNPGPSPVPKPVADVINLSLGSTAGDPAASNSRAANNAALAGTIVVASAGNSGSNIGTVGNPGVATLAIGVAASLDPGSVAGAGVLAPGEVSDPRLPATPGPTPEVGQTSNQNMPQPGERQGMRIFPVAGGGPLPAESNPAQPVQNNSGSISAHYVFVDRRDPATPIPTSVGNRIALVKFTGTFAAAANALAAQPVPPSAILLITSVESATAVQVIRGIPTFTIGENDGNYLIDRMITGDPGDGDPNVDVPPGTISELPMRLQESVTNADFNGVMAGFSSRGPNDHPNANYRVLKPDVTGPGVGIVGAATIEGIPDDAIGLASTTGYTSANGTSFSAPITAGAMALIRQYVRNVLNLDSTDPADRTRRFDTVTVARALLQNSATNLRNGLGQPQGNGSASVASINDMGSGHINIAAALAGDAIMVAPTLLLTNPNEYTPTPPATGSRTVLIPTASFGSVPVVRLNDTLVRTQEVVIRDVSPSGAGGGTYNLTVQDNRNTLNNPAFQITMVGAQNSTTPITSINVPAGGQASFFVRVTADGQQLVTPSEEFMWYVSATHNSTAKSLRMPFYFRAVNALVPNSAAPNQQAPQGNEGQPVGNCATDTNGSYTINWTYTGPTLLRFRVQEGTFSQSIFFDNADEPLMPNAAGTTVVHENTRWRDAGISGTPQTPPQWTTEANPDTMSPAYFIPNGQNQNHSLTMRNRITLPATGLTLSFTSRESITTSTNPGNANYGFVELSTDDVAWQPILRVNGTFSGRREIDLSGYAGQSIRLRFRLQTNLGTVSGAQGWWVENIDISSDDFATIGEPLVGSNSLAVTGRRNGSYFYRVAGIYANPNPDDVQTTVTGPYSNLRCVTVTGVVGAVSRKFHGAAGGFDIPLPFNATPPIPSMRGIEPRSGGTEGRHTIVFQFPESVSAVDTATVTGQNGTPTIIARDAGPGPNEYTVAIGNVADVQTVVVTLTGVRNAGGTNIGNFSVPMGVLLGDATGNGTVNATDVGQAKSLSGLPADAGTFRNDVNVNGAINSSDISTIKSTSGNTLP